VYLSFNPNLEDYEFENNAITTMTVIHINTQPEVHKDLLNITFESKGWNGKFNGGEYIPNL
jgi:hypothetical protein